MDPKASAKSKRSHSQHGRKSHPTPSAPGSHKNKKPTQTKGSEQGGDHKPKPPRTPGPSLPSNWHRYEEDYEFEGEHREIAIPTESGEKVEGVGGTVAVKSKGADFRYLIEQARSQRQDELLWNAGETERPASTVDLTDYLGGFGSMLIARGKSIFSSCGEDDFIVDDITTSNLEIPFSWDLDALGAHLEKLKMSERLFIEPEYIPEELELEVQKKADETGSGSREGSSAAKDDFAPESCTQHAWSRKGKESYPVTISTDDEVNLSDAPVSTSKDDGVNVCNAHVKVSPSGSHHVSALVKEPSNSDAAATKAELDALVDLIGDFEISSSPGFGGQTNSSVLALTEPHMKSGSLDSLSPSSNLSFMNPGRKAFDMDDALDGLLSESRNFVRSYNKPEAKSDVGVSRETFASADSISTRTFPGTPSLDDSIDDLLAETSSVNNVQKSLLTSVGGVQHDVKESMASAFSDKLSKALDDLDSLLDL